MRAPSTAAGRRDADASVSGADPAPRARRPGAAVLDAAAWQSYDALLEGIIVIDAESHVIVAANSAAAALIGADRDDIVGRECHQFVCPKERGQCPISDLAQTVDRLERVLITADGRRLPVLKTVTQTGRGSREYLVESVQDLGELRRSWEHSSHLGGLLASMRAVTMAGSLQEALSVVARMAVKALDSAACIVYEFDDAVDVVVARAHFEVSASDWDELGVPLPVSEHPIERALLKSRQPLEESLSDPGLDTVSREAMETWGDKTSLSVPLYFGNECKGFLTVSERERERHFTEDEIALLGGFCEQAAAAIHQAQMVRRLEERNRRLAALAEAGEAMVADEALERVLPEVARHAVEALQSYCCLVDEYVADGEMMIERAYFCSDPTDTYELKSWPLSEDDWGTRSILSGGEIAERHLSDPELGQALRESMERWGERTCLIVPLVFHEEPIGLLVLTETAGERHFSAEDREFAVALGRQAAAAIHSAP
jgi:PAS domain S-box-containing protein